MGFFNFLNKAKDTAQNIPGVDQASQAVSDGGSAAGDAVQNIPGTDAVSQAGQNITDATSGVAGSAQNVTNQAVEHLSNLSDKLPKL